MNSDRLYQFSNFKYRRGLKRKKPNDFLYLLPIIALAGFWFGIFVSIVVH